MNLFLLVSDKCKDRSRQVPSAQDTGEKRQGFLSPRIKRKAWWLGDFAVMRDLDKIDLKERVDFSSQFQRDTVHHGRETWQQEGKSG